MQILLYVAKSCAHSMDYIYKLSSASQTYDLFFHFPGTNMKGINHCGSSVQDVAVVTSILRL